MSTSFALMTSLKQSGETLCNESADLFTFTAQQFEVFVSFLPAVPNEITAPLEGCGRGCFIFSSNEAPGI